MKMQNKFKNINNKKEEELRNNDIKKLIYLALGVTLVFFIFYGITYIVLKNANNNETTEAKTEIDLNQILISHLFNQPEEKYFVLVTIKNDANNNTYESLKEEYYKKEDHLKIYNANLNDPLNSSFVGDETDLQGELKNFKFSKSTLVEIDNKTIKSIYNGSSEILEKLNSMK